MITTTLSAFNLCKSQVIALGRQLENNYRQIVFDCSDFSEEITAITLIHQRKDDVAPYIVATSTGDTLTWTITDTDTAYYGYGKGELRITFDSGLAKSIVFTTMVIKSITADTTIPTALQSWYDAMIAYINGKIADSEGYATAAQTSAETAAQKASDSEAWAVGERNGTAVGSTDETYQNNSKYYAEETADVVSYFVNTTVPAKVAEVTAEGTEQIGLVEAAGTAQISAVNSAGSSQITAIENKGATTLASIPADYTSLSTQITELNEAINIEKVNIIDPSKYSSSNAAVTYNGDGTYTIGTTDYGTTVFNNNKKISLQVGTYELYGVPNGIAFISPTSSYNVNTAIGSNTTNTSKKITITEPVDAYVGFRIAPKPSTSFTIEPYLKQTVSDVSDVLDVGAVVDLVTEDTYNLAQFSNAKYQTFSVIVTTDASGKVSFSGTASGSGTNAKHYVDLTLPAGTYTFRTENDHGTLPLARVYTSDESLLGTAPAEFTLASETSVFITFAFTSGTAYSSDTEIFLASSDSSDVMIPAITAVDSVARNSLTGLTNYLNGKKLFCAGDSITEGSGVGSFTDGLKKTYGGYVAERNNMTYVSDGVGGSTMGKCTVDGTVLNNFITSRYLSIPTDADFITLWFGWNDNAYGWHSARDEYCVANYGTYYTALTTAQQEEVDAYKTWRQWLAVYAGSADSTSITTWGGAWNTVLTWLLENCPNSRIGIVIAYGMNTELSDVLIAICEKYGVAYIKAYDPHEFFSVGHSDGIGSNQATKRKALYTLDNTHPNELGYEMMSAGFESFLRRI